MSQFGWSYPPGAANDPNAPWNQVDGPCEVCMRPTDDCICPECPVCQGQGDPACYPELGSLTHPPHGTLQLSKAQQASRSRARIAELKEQIQDEEMFLAQLDESENPDEQCPF